MDANNPESSAAAKSSSLLSDFCGSSSYNHETETIFALPRMQLDFKSIHVQDPKEPSLTDSSSKPKVLCSVVTEITDDICVTMDAKLIRFLHELVSAYLKEKEKEKEEFFSAWRWKAYDHRPYEQMSLLEAMNAGYLEIGA